MTELLGKSVGEWTSNPYVNMFGMYGGGTNPLNTFRDKACSNFIVSPQMCNITISEWSSRASANKTLKNYGLSQADINKAWSDFKDQVQGQFDRTKFVNFAKEQVQSQADNQSNDSSGGRGRNNTDVNTDRNGNPTTGDNGGQSSGGGSTSPKRNTNTSTTSNTTPKAKSNTNLYLYGGIGLAVIVGAFLIFRKK